MNFLALVNSYTTPLLQRIPLVYTYNEYDFQGPKGSDSSSKYIGALNEAYRKIFPSYPLISSEGSYQSFKANGVLFLVTDSRTFMDRTSGSIFGTQQLNWLKTNLASAASDTSVRAIIITFTQAWNYVEYFYDQDILKQDFYAVLSNMQGDKIVVGNTTKGINFRDKTAANYKPIMLVSGERSLSLDNGNFNNYGNFPIVMCGPMDSWSQCRGGPYSHGSFHDGTNQYCLFNIYQSSSNEACLAVRGVVNGENGANDTVVFKYDTCQPASYPARINQKCPILWTEKILNGALTTFGILLIYYFFYVYIFKVAQRALTFKHIKDK